MCTIFLLATAHALPPYLADLVFLSMMHTHRGANRCLLQNIHARYFQVIPRRNNFSTRVALLHHIACQECGPQIYFSAQHTRAKQGKFLSMHRYAILHPHYHRPCDVLKRRHIASSAPPNRPKVLSTSLFLYLIYFFILFIYNYKNTVF